MKSVLLCIALLASVALAQHPSESIDRDLSDDHFAAGGIVQVNDPVKGDLIAAGSAVNVIGTVEGDALLSGGNITLSGRVGRSVYVIAGHLRVQGAVGHNVRAVGGRIAFDELSVVEGNVSIAGGEVTLDGRVKGYVQMEGGHLVINGLVTGDVEANAGQLEIGPYARLSGKLRYARQTAVKRHPASQVLGTIEAYDPPGGWRVPFRFEQFNSQLTNWLLTVGFLLLTAVLAATCPELQQKVAKAITVQWGQCAIAGLLIVVCAPVLAVLALATVVGVPIALLTFSTLTALIVIGYVAIGMAMGQILLHHTYDPLTSVRRWRIGAALFGMLSLSLLVQLPWFGAWIALLSVILGCGALVMQAWQFRTRCSAVLA
jgi:hypothetical protein